MEENSKHRETEFNQRKIGRPFSVPEGYFDNLEVVIIQKTIEAQSPKTQHNQAFSIVKYSIAAFLAIGLITSAVLLFSPKDSKSKIAIDNKKKELFKKKNIKQEDLKKQNIEIVNQTPKAVDTIMNITLDNQKIQKNKSIPNTHLQDNEMPVIVNYNSQKSTNRSNKPNTNLGQIPFNQDANNSPIYSQHIFDGSDSQSKNGADIARIHKPINEKIINLPVDTCSVSPVILRAITDQNKINNYTYQWSTGAKTPSITIYESGIYEVNIYQKGLKQPLDSATINFRLVTRPEPELGPDQTICSHESLSLKANTYDPEYKYHWSIGNSKSETLFLNRLKPGEHKITVSVEACGTIETDAIYISVKECILEFTNVITPNGDGKNEQFVVLGLENFPGSQLFIMDRNGKIVFESLNYQNNWNGQNLPSGTYFYLLKLKDGKMTEKGGSLTIIR